MPRKYAAFGSASAGTNKTILAVTSAATIRPELYDILLSSSGTAGDNASIFYAARYTAAGTATSVTPIALDPGDPAALAAAGKAHTVEPTYTANAILLEFAVNQRATFRWVAVPGGELKCPATASNGIGVYTPSSTGTPTIEATIHWCE